MRDKIAVTRRGIIRSLAALGAGAGLAGHARASPPPAVNSCAFLALGDWGMEGNVGQRAVASALGQEAVAVGARFVISTGDNFYRTGVSGFDDPRWKTSFEDVYVAPALSIPWYPVLGNHDRRGNAMAEIAYSSVSDRWCMPGPYYRRREILADGAFADFFFLDTEMINRETSEYADVLSGDDDDDQMNWLALELAASRARWKVVIGHHPVFSGGQHGDTAAMKRTVRPLLERYGVHAYVCGHDHCLQDIVVQGIHYLTTGAGSSTKPAASVAGTKFVASRLGFLAAEVEPDALSFRFVDADLRELYRATLSGS